MKHIIGSIIISFGILIVLVLMLITLKVQAPENVMTYLGLAWIFLAIVSYPIARRVVRS